MGLLDRVNTTISEREVAKFDEMNEEVARRQEIDATRSKIVSTQVGTIAQQLKCNWLELGVNGSSRYFLLDDIVISVRLHGLPDKGKQEDTRPTEVLWQYAVFVVGVYDGGSQVSVREVGQSTLRLCNFDTLVKSIQAHPYLDFSKDKVVLALYPED